MTEEQMVLVRVYFTAQMDVEIPADLAEDDLHGHAFQQAEADIENDEDVRHDLWASLLPRDALMLRESNTCRYCGRDLNCDGACDSDDCPGNQENEILRSVLTEALVVFGDIRPSDLGPRISDAWGAAMLSTISRIRAALGWKEEYRS
jgi:hypothetical protein